jgi:hypothetical protein
MYNILRKDDEESISQLLDYSMHTCACFSAMFLDFVNLGFSFVDLPENFQSNVCTTEVCSCNSRLHPFIVTIALIFVN